MVRYLAQARADRHGGTPTPLHYYDLGSGQFDETSTYPFTGTTPTRLYFGAERDADQHGAARQRQRHEPGAAGLDTHTRQWRARNVSSARRSSRALTRSDSASHAVRYQRATRSSGARAGAACGRSIDQWSMGGISVPAGEAGLLAPAPTTTKPRQIGPWAISYTTRSVLTHAETVAGPIDATVYASATTSQTELVAELEDVTPAWLVLSAHRGRAARLTENREQEPVVDRCRRDHPPLPPVHGVLSASPVTAGRRDRVPDPAVPDAGDDRRRRTACGSRCPPPTLRT